MRIQKNVLLKNYTTFKIGGRADYFLRATTLQDLIEGVKWAKENRLPFFVLGGGSNVLISDRGVRGFVIKIDIKGLKIKGKEIVAQSGTPLSDIVKAALNSSLSGVEWMAGIPGTLGGAVRGNIGAFGSSISDIVKEVKAFDARKQRVVNLCKKKCGFSQKESIFKKNKDLIIMSVVLELKKGERRKIKKKIEEFISYRERNHPLEFASAGCAFKNVPFGEFSRTPQGRKAVFEFKKDMENFRKLGFVPTAFLIEKCGLKGRAVGGAQISNLHANFIINKREKAKAQDVIQLIELAKKEVKKRFGVEPKEEIQYLGEF